MFAILATKDGLWGSYGAGAACWRPVFGDEMTFVSRGQKPYRLAISAYAEPEQYIPYVHGLARVIAEAVVKLTPP